MTLNAMSIRLDSVKGEEIRQCPPGVLLPTTTDHVDASGFRTVGISYGVEQVYALILTNRLDTAHDEATAADAL